MANDGFKRMQQGILGDINPTRARRATDPAATGTADRPDAAQSMDGGSQHGQSEHSGSRDVTEGVTGGVGTEVGGTRNYRQGTGATGGDIGNRPE